jgi:hypothetical protein
MNRGGLLSVATRGAWKPAPTFPAGVSYVSGAK